MAWSKGGDVMPSMVCRWPTQCMIAVLLLFVTLSYAWALSLDEAKDRGLVGERSNGYLGVVSGKASPEVQTLIEDINQKRQQRYQEIANRNNTNLQAVELLAGKTAIKKTKPGDFIQLPSGQWIKK